MGVPAAGVIGCGMVGLGIANVIPILFSAAGRAPGIPTGTALAAVATTGYLGFLAGPPVRSPTRSPLDRRGAPVPCQDRDEAPRMEEMRPLSIPVILGTVRQGRQSAHVARLMVSELSRRSGVTTELIDIAALPLRVDDAGEAIKDPTFAAQMNGADALVVVSPEYNHGYSGMLKHVLDSCLKEYVHKAVGVVGVSAGPFGGARGIQDLLPVLRELGLVTIFWDVHFAAVQDVFDESGALREPAYLPRIDKFLKELIWMARTLRHGREHIALE